MKPNSLFKGKYTKKALFVFVPVILCAIIVCVLAVSLNDRSTKTEKVAGGENPDIMSSERGDEEDMDKLYNRINFENAPSTKTPLNEENLNKMDSAINDLDNRVIETHDELKSDLGELKDSFLTFKTETAQTVTVDSDNIYICSKTNATVTHTGKNQLEKPYFHRSPLISGIQFTYNDDDGSVRAVGTATENATYAFSDEQTSKRRTIKKGTYTLSGGISNNCYCVIGITGVGQYVDYGTGVTFDVVDDTTCYLKFVVLKGTSVDTTIYPQLEFGNIKTAWSKYEKETIETDETFKKVESFEGVNVFMSDSEFTVKYPVENKVVLLTEYAKGDGVTDDTVAINKALSDATNGTLVIPSGTFLVSGTLHVHSNTKIIGCGADSIIKLADNFNLESYDWRDYGGFYKRYPIMITDENSEMCEFRDFVIVGQTSAFVDHDEDGLVIRGNNHIAENVIVHDINYFTEEWTSRNSSTMGYGIFVFNADTVTVNNCHLYNCGYQGFGVEKSATVTLSNSKIGASNQTGVQVHRSCEHIRIIGNTIDLSERVNGHACLTFDAPVDYPLQDIYVTGNYIGGTVTTVGGGESNIFIIGNTIDGQIQGNENYYLSRVDIQNNHINGRIRIFADKSMVSSNIINNDTTGSAMISIHGNDVLAINNLAIGSGSTTVSVTPH
jgi:hypothetical protein